MPRGRPISNISMMEFLVHTSTFLLYEQFEDRVTTRVTSLPIYECLYHVGVEVTGRGVLFPGESVETLAVSPL